MELKTGYKMTEVGTVPIDWAVANLSEISTKITDGEHVTPIRTTHGHFLLSARNVLNGRLDVSDVDYVGDEEFARIKKRCNPEPGDILISCSGTVGRISVVPQDFECVLVRSAALAKLDRLKVDSGFIQFWLQSEHAQGQIFRSVNQGAQPNLFLNHIERLKCPFPSLPEQSAISSALSDVDALLTKLDQIITKKRDLKQAAMQQLLTGQTRLPGFRGKWELKRLGELGECLRGVTYKGDSDLRPHDTSHTKRLLRSNNVQSSTIVIADIQYVNADRVSENQVLRANDILICMANGSKALVGKAGFFRVEDGYDYTFGAFMGCFRSNTVESNSSFVFYLFQTGRYRNYINNLLAGSSINNLSPGSIESLEFRIPPMLEQTAIAAVLSDMDAELTAGQLHLKKVPGRKSIHAISECL
jgi:type I restriction enzyme S subunit